MTRYEVFNLSLILVFQLCTLISLWVQVILYSIQCTWTIHKYNTFSNRYDNYVKRTTKSLHL